VPAVIALASPMWKSAGAEFHRGVGLKKEIDSIRSVLISGIAACWLSLTIKGAEGPKYLRLVGRRLAVNKLKEMVAYAAEFSSWRSMPSEERRQAGGGQGLRTEWVKEDALWDTAKAIEFTPAEGAGDELSACAILASGPDLVPRAPSISSFRVCTRNDGALGPFLRWTL